MADENAKVIETELVLKGPVSHKSGERKDGKGTWNIWKAQVEGGHIDGNPGLVSTFSDNAAKVLEEHAGKGTVLKFTLKSGAVYQNVVEWEVQKIVGDDAHLLYEPDQKKGQNKGGYRGGGGPPDWSMRDPAERAEERRSIEAQKTLEYAVRSAECAVQYDNTLESKDAIVDFIMETWEKYRTTVREAATTGLPAAVQRAGGNTREPSGQAELPSGKAAPPARSNGDVEQLLTNLEASFGSRSKVLVAYKKRYDKTPAVENMTTEELTSWIAELAVSA